MLVETKARVGVFAIALGAYLPQFGQIRSSIVGVRGLPWQPSMIIRLASFLTFWA